MNKSLNKRGFAEILKERFQKEMPKIIKEINIYETRLKEGKLNVNPNTAPQFNR